MWIRQSTTQTVALGPFVDATDGATAETGLSLTVYISKNGAAAATRNSTSSITHDRDGTYRVPLSATDTNTTGGLRLMASPAGALPVWRDLLVVPAAVYDALVGGTASLVVALGAGAVNDESLSTAAALEVAAAVWDVALDSHQLAGSTGEALGAAGAAGDPWATTLPGAYPSGSAGWVVGTRLDAKISSMAGNSPGAGAVEFEYTLLDEETAAPIADADVWATTDAAGNAVVASGRTNQYGRVTFYLDAGTIYLWRQKSGWSFVNPDVAVV